MFSRWSRLPCRVAALAAMVCLVSLVGVQPALAGAPQINQVDDVVLDLPRTVQIEDTDGDGYGDLLTTHYAASSSDMSSFSVSLGNGDGTFQGPTVAGEWSWATPQGRFEVTDLDNDDVLDVAITSYSSQGLDVLLGNGDGTFQAPQHFSTEIHPQDVAVADFNGDGVVDLAAAGAPGTGSTPTIAVLFGNGDGFGFDTVVYYSAGSSADSIIAGNFNLAEDEYPDLAVTVDSGAVSVLLNDGNGAFGTPSNHTVWGAWDVTTANFDPALDTNGYQDLAVSAIGGVYVLLGNGDGTFGSAVRYGGTYDASLHYVNIERTDFDGDGYVDLVVNSYRDVADGDTEVRVLPGNGDGTFQDASSWQVVPDGTYNCYDPGSLGIGDFNDDARPDIAVVNSALSNVSILLNTTGDPTSYTVAVTASPTEAGTVDGGGTYAEDVANVTVTATPNTGWEFIGWYEAGILQSTANSYSFPLGATDHELVATFMPIEHFVGVSANPEDGGTVDGIGEYQEGHDVTVTATSNTGWEFANWTEDGSDVSANAEYTFTLGSTDRYLVANFRLLPGYHLVTVTPDRPDAGSVSGGGAYAKDAWVEVTATPNTGWDFVGWYEGAILMSTDSSYTFPMPDADVDLMAVFEQQHYTIALTPNTEEGGWVDGDGTYVYGAEITVFAIPYDNYHFVDWTEGGTVVSTDSSCLVVVTRNYDLVANFEQDPGTYRVTVAADPAGGGTVDGDGVYAVGDSVTVTATPNAGYEFVNWTEDGAQVSTNPEYTFAMDATDHDLVAHFIPTHTVTILVNPEGYGEVTGDGTYAEGSSVTVTATPYSNSEFVNWTEGGAIVSRKESFTFTMGTTNRILVANFAYVPTYSVRVTPSPAEGGTTDGGGSYEEGDRVKVTATPNEGWGFVNWTCYDGTEVSTNASYTFRMPAGNLDLRAHFEQGWPKGIRLSTTNVTGDSVALTLSEPVSWAIGYRITWESGSADFAGDEWTSMQITGLDPAASYTFTLSAQNSSGEWVDGGPSRKVRTRK